jgi:prefoldin beta subunit
MDSQVQEKIGQIQLIQQNLENFSMQRQQFQLQLSEIESALAELGNSKQTYKIIGNIMVLVDNDKLSKDLTEKKEMLDIRIATIEKQEDKLKLKAEEIQHEVMKSLEEKAASPTTSANEKKKSRKQNDQE